MDESRFDQTLKAFAAASGRRTALRALGGAAMALLAVIGLPDVGDARKKKVKNKKKKKCKGGTKKCGKKCIPATDCCTDADCDGGTCVDGTCQCLGGSKPCDGACIPEGGCCNASDCDDGNPCTQSVCNGNGTCSFPNKPDLSYCGGNNYCSGGVCATLPDCQSVFGPCGVHAHCCSNFCGPTGQPVGICTASNPGQPCRLPTDCVNSSCVGFVCTQ
jgi:hypothetical protein